MELISIKEDIDRIFQSVESLRDEIRKKSCLEEKILLEFESMKTSLVKKTSKKVNKPKPAPLTHEEIQSHKILFNELFDKWRNGKELEVKEILEENDVESLRRFADANNLNITSKMSKLRVLQLIDTRFREKKMILM